MKKIENYLARSDQYFTNNFTKTVLKIPLNFGTKLLRPFLRKNGIKVLDFDFNKPEFKWFVNGKLNITENCLDRHLVENPKKTAILFEPNDPN